MATKRGAKAKTLHWPESGSFFQTVAGVSYRQQELAALTTWRKGVEQVLYATATLAPEPGNQYDPLAVKVLVQGQSIGYLPKDAAPRYHRLIASVHSDSQLPAATTAAVRIIQRQFEHEVGYAAALDMHLEHAPNFDEAARPRLPAPALMPRFYDSFAIKDGYLVIMSLDVGQYTAQRCYAGAELEIWMPKGSEDVYAYAPRSDFGLGKVFETDMALLRSIGFNSVDEFDPIVYAACGHMVMTCAKLPATSPHTK